MHIYFNTKVREKFRVALGVEKGGIVGERTDPSDKRAREKEGVIMLSTLFY